MLRKRKSISDLSEAELKEVFRIKDEMRVSLIDIAKSKRQYNNRESDFETRLRDGKHSSMFKMEYRKLRKKKVELEKLEEQLKGPNSKLLASNLTSELKNVEAKAEKEAKQPESKYRGRWLAPLKNKAKVEALLSEAGSSSALATEPSKIPGADFANLVQMVHKQFKKASISGKNSADVSKDKVNVDRHCETSDSCPTSKMADQISDSQVPKQTEAEIVHRTDTDSGLYPVSRLHKPLIPIDSTSSDDDSDVEVKRKRRHRIDGRAPILSTVPELSESPVPKAPAPKPDGKRSKKQKARAQMMKGIQKDAEVTRTDSARRRDRHVKKRLSTLATRTKEDIANRRSISPNVDMEAHFDTGNSDEALNSIHQAEVVARLQLSRSKVGITLPELRRDKKAKSEARPPRDQAVSLPPVNVDGHILRELKEQRRKHKDQSSGLPKLP